MEKGKKGNLDFKPQIHVYSCMCHTYNVHELRSHGVPAALLSHLRSILYATYSRRIKAVITFKYNNDLNWVQNL